MKRVLIIAAGLAVLCGAAARADADGVDVRISMEGRHVDVRRAKPVGWTTKAWRDDRLLADPTGGSELHIANLSPGTYHLLVTLHDEKADEKRKGTLTASFNGKELGTRETGVADGQAVWELTIPKEAFGSSNDRALRFVRTGYPIGLKEVRICTERPAGADPAAFQWIGPHRYLRQRYVNPPVWRVTPMDGAASYRCELTGTVAGDVAMAAEVTSKTPELNLEGLWKGIPPTPDGDKGRMYKAVLSALDAKGTVLGQEELTFARRPSFEGPVIEARSDYLESGRRAAHYLINSYGPKSRQAKKLQMGGFPALFYSMIIDCLVTYAELLPGDEEAATAIETASRLAKHAIENSTPADWAYGSMPLSHTERKTNKYQVCRGPMVGMAYVRVYAATKDKTFLDAAMRVADTLKKTQLPDGRWHFRVNAETGEVLEDYTSDQAHAILLLEKLIEDHGKKDLEETLQRAVSWMLEYPCRSYDWRGQWDDVNAGGASHGNVESYDAGLFAMYLARHATPGNGYVEIAADLCRLVEDQFVEWAPCTVKAKKGNEMLDLVVPGMREQYCYWKLVDASAAQYMRVCLALHEATGEAPYLERARALADAMTAIQHPQSGHYITVDPCYEPGSKETDDPRPVLFTKAGTGWANCTGHTGATMMRLATYMAQSKKKE